MQKSKVGPKPKLTPNVHKAVMKALGFGCPLKEAAEYAGVHPSTLYRWLERGRRRKAGPFRRLSDDVLRALRPEPKPIVARTRHIRRAYERGLTHLEIQSLVYREIRRIIDEGRVCDEDVLRALEMVCADYDDEVENLSISWAEVQVPWRGR